MDLVLTTAERELLLEILKEHDRELFREIARTDHRELRSVLQNKETLLGSVVHKLETGMAMQRSA